MTVTNLVSRHRLVEQETDTHNYRHRIKVVHVFETNACTYFFTDSYRMFQMFNKAFLNIVNCVRLIWIRSPSKRLPLVSPQIASLDCYELDIPNARAPSAICISK